MELDLVDAVPEPVVRAQHRGIRVGQPAPVLGLLTAGQLAEGNERLGVDVARVRAGRRAGARRCVNVLTPMSGGGVLKTSCVGIPPVCQEAYSAVTDSSGTSGSANLLASTTARDSISALIGSVTSQTLTFIPASTRPAASSQKAMNSRRFELAADDHLVVRPRRSVAGVLHAEVVLVGVEVGQQVIARRPAEHARSGDGPAG